MRSTKSINAQKSEVSIEKQTFNFNKMVVLDEIDMLKVLEELRILGLLPQRWLTTYRNVNLNTRTIQRPWSFHSNEHNFFR